MLRLALLVVYLIASFSIFGQAKGGGGWDPAGLNPPPPPETGERGGGWDPDG